MSLKPEERRFVEGNLAHWEGNAAAFGAGAEASWGDRHAMELEIENVLEHVQPGMRVLDAGCANGFVTFRVLGRSPGSVRAFDYAPGMVAAARAAQAERDPDGAATFYQGDIQSIQEPSGAFDLVYAIRVLINLPSWERQQVAIREMHRVLAPGGRYVLCEAFAGSQRKLNALRALGGLPPLRAPEFNVYLEEEALEAFAGGLFEVESVRRFSSLYYVGTRFARDLAMAGGEAPSYDGAFNRFFGGLRATARSGDFGIQKCYVLRKAGGG